MLVILDQPLKDENGNNLYEETMHVVLDQNQQLVLDATGNPKVAIIKDTEKRYTLKHELKKCCLVNKGQLSENEKIKRYDWYNRLSSLKKEKINLKINEVQELINIIKYAEADIWTMGQCIDMLESSAN